jgi:hypothetical protein
MTDTVMVALAVAPGPSRPQAATGIAGRRYRDEARRDLTDHDPARVWPASPVSPPTSDPRLTGRAGSSRHG